MAEENSNPTVLAGSAANLIRSRQPFAITEGSL